MKRREFIAALGGAVAWPLAARTQPADRMQQVGILVNQAEDDRIAVLTVTIRKSILNVTDFR